MAPAELLPRLLIFFGIGFLIANLKVMADVVRFRLRRPSAVLVWNTPKPPLERWSVLLAIVLALLVAAKLIQRRPLIDVFGETMMLVYYGCAIPLSSRISRGFYRDGIWSDSGFMQWAHISAVSWKEEGAAVTLILISRIKSMARRLEVPGNMYGEVRRVLRDKIKTHDIHIGGAGLDLGSRDESDAV